MIERIKEYLEAQEDVLFAFLFGSYAEGRAGRLSDVDIAIYLQKEDGEREEEIWWEIEKRVKKEVDLLVLNRAKPLVAWSAIKRGKLLTMKDRRKFLEYMLEVSAEAEDFLEFNLDTLRRRLALRK